MKPRKIINTRVDSRGDIGPRFVDGEQTVFGLVITPYLSYRGFDPDCGYDVTEPATGLSVARGWTKLEALQRLKEVAREQRGIHGSFVAALDSARRYQRIIQVAEERKSSHA